MLNLNHPAVIIQCYGKDKPVLKTMFSYRGPKYLESISVGNDPDNLITRKMISHMVQIVDSLQHILQSNGAIINLHDYNVIQSFNHFTVLLYYADENGNMSYSMDYHSDYTYSLKDYKFDNTRKSQVQYIST